LSYCTEFLRSAPERAEHFGGETRGKERRRSQGIVKKSEEKRKEGKRI
jgi:hypothetical protein